MKLGKRMKQYENNYNIKLTNRLPVILRIDGNSFSKFTKKMKFKKPFDDTFIEAMDITTRAILEYCSGSIIGYYQSDEISILLKNDQTVNTSPFLGNRLQKLTSLVSGVASSKFSLHFNTPAVFDCRAFVIPENEISNYFYWRQWDCYKNSINLFAYYSLTKKYGKKTAQKMLHKKHHKQQLDMIYENGITYHEEPIEYRLGVCLKKYNETVKIRDIIKPENISKVSKKELNKEKIISRWKPVENLQWFKEYGKGFYY